MPVPQALLIFTMYSAVWWSAPACRCSSCSVPWIIRKMTFQKKKERDMSHALKKAIQSSVRKGDFYTKYNMRQYIIMLIGISQENCPMVSRRIEKAFRKCSGEKKSLQVDFYVASVGEVCESDGVIVDRRT